MRVALYGDGNARDHAAFSRLRAESRSAVFFARRPNGLLAGEPGVITVESTKEAAELAVESADAVLILDPIHLIHGAADIFSAKNLSVAAPSAAQSALEGSKALSKRVLGDTVPAPPAIICHDLASVLRHLRGGWKEGSRRFVLKSDRFLRNAHFRSMVPETLEDALKCAAGQWAVIQNEAPGPVILEERLVGEELSVHLAFAGDDYILFPPVKDYKRAFDRDCGPNTHGVAALASGAGYVLELERTLRRTVIEPVLLAIAQAHLGYSGFLYIGVMLTPDGPQVLELNVRPGNPEFTALLPLLESGFGDLLEALCNRTLGRYRVSWRSSEFAMSVFATAEGYPEMEAFDPEPIRGTESAYRSGSLLGEGIGRSGEGLVVTGGRVVLATAGGQSLEAVRAQVYNTLNCIHFRGAHFRRDIGDGISAGIFAPVLSGSTQPRGELCAE